MTVFNKLKDDIDQQIAFMSKLLKYNESEQFKKIYKNNLRDYIR